MKKALQRRLETVSVTTSGGIMNTNHLVSKAPELAMAENKVKAREKTQEGSKLVPLTLPDGVTPEIAARLTTSILMRSVYCSTSPWTQWILLASVGILNGEETPKLDSVRLHILQGTVNEKIVWSDFGNKEEGNRHLSDVKEEKSDNLEGNTSSDKEILCTVDGKDTDIGLESNSFHVNRSPKGSKCISKKHCITREQSSFKKSSPCSNKRDISPTLNCPNENGNLKKLNNYSPKVLKRKYNQETGIDPSKDSSTSFTQINTLINKVDSNVEGKSSVIQESIGIQVTPKKLGISVSKWIQVKEPKKIDAGIQTELKQSQNMDTQIQSNGSLKEFVSKEVQTILMIKRTKGTQTDDGETGVIEGEAAERVENEWVLQSLSDVPDKKSPKSVKKQKLKNYLDNDSGEQKDSTENCNASNIGTQTVKRKKDFHGRPLLTGKSAKPVEIPLYRLVNIMDSDFLLDPRINFTIDYD